MNRAARVTRYLLRHSFIRFAAIGTFGYLVDTGMLALDTNVWGMDFTAGRALSILVAMGFTWLGNRYLTFPEYRARTLPGAAQEWLKFVGANAVGAVINYGTSVLLVRYAAAPFDHKFIAQAIGVLAGLIFNFTLSKTLVFRKPA
ncbi:MAG TPA: GtrA family protein [Rhizomicrobium sp.]|nr:GtrA family protein [Rhizomicrobium sp.]